MNERVADGDIAGAQSLDELYPKLHAQNIMPDWSKPMASLYKEPLKNFRPAHWRWKMGRKRWILQAG
jgi:gentisate 1,2-dioxygenase